MQVVINRKPGSFALTDAALLEIYRLDPTSAALRVVHPEEAARDAYFEEMFFVQTADGNFVQQAPDSRHARACPALVSVVGRLGAGAAEKTAQLEVIEAPTGLAAYAGMSGDEVMMSRKVRTYA